MSSEQYYTWQYFPWNHEAGDNLFCFVFLLVCLFFSNLFAVCFFCGVIHLFSSGWETSNLFYLNNISGRGEILNYNGLRQMRLISLHDDIYYTLCLNCWAVFSLFIPAIWNRTWCGQVHESQNRCGDNWKGTLYTLFPWLPI